ncbi:hypothetical protein AHAS_Ahas11G0227100 [Arachis hypogaea]
MAVLLWCIFTDQPLNLPRHLRHAMGHVQIAGNLPFPALVSDLVSAAGVSYRAGDTKTILMRDDQYVSNGKYIRPPAATTSRPAELAGDILFPSTSQAPSTNQLLLQILERLDRLDRTRSHVNLDCGDSATCPPLFLTNGTEDGAKL